MSGQVFCYITYKGGVPDDSALELVTAAKQLNAGTAASAVVVASSSPQAAATTRANASTTSLVLLALMVSPCCSRPGYL